MREGPEPRKEAMAVLDLQILPTRAGRLSQGRAFERLFCWFSSPRGSLTGVKEALLLSHPRGPRLELSGEMGLM